MRTVFVLALLCGPSAASAASYTVCTGTCTFATLALAHAGAADGDTLTIMGNLTETGAVTITKDLTIVSGASSRPSISLATGANTLTFNSSAVASLSGVKVVPGSSRAIEVSGGARVTFDDILVESASKSVNGVGLYVNNGIVTVTDSTFQNLTSTASGAAVYLTNASTVADFDNVTFYNNTSSADGGAIYADDVDLGVTDCTFSANDAGDDGGAVYLKGSGVYATSGSTFSTNTSVDAGGAVFQESAPATWTATTFSSNDSTGNGGAFYLSSADTTFDACDFDSNASASTYGGDLRLVSSDVVVQNGSTFNGGSADYGGSIVVDSGSTLNVSDAAFTGGSADYGGHIYAVGNVTIDATTFSGGSATYRGGSIDIDTGVLTVTDSAFTSNVSVSGADYIYGGGAIAFENDADGTITGTTFTTNDAANDGGAIYVYDGDDLALTDCTFTGNTTDATGGAITFWTNNTLDVVGTTFTSNTSLTGGAITAWEWDASVGLDVTTSSFASNVSTGYGGAIYVNIGDTVNVTDSTFSANDGYAGGGLFVYDNTGAAVTAYRNWFCENTADTDGGAVWVYSLDTGQTHRIASNFFVENVALDEGGALYVSTSSTLDVTNNTVLANTGASAKGGGVFAGTVDFLNNLVAYTVAGDGFRSASTSGTYTYNGWYTNTSANMSGSISTLDSTNVTGSDPLLFDYTTGDGCSGDFRVRVSGPMVDKGSTSASYYDKDGTRADIGAYGGPYADADWWVDGDGDGTRWVYDCDDADATVEPGATETCDGVDEDCDGTIDEGATSGTTYLDADGDGYGTSSKTSTACPPPSGYVAASGDCNDASGAVSPGATETCNGVDDDCDGTIDDGVTTTYYADTDGDGYGNAASSTAACSAPSGYVANSTDCNDASASVKPGGTETCNSVDDDCDGSTDEGASDASTWYADTDSDGYGNASSTTASCTKPSGYVADATDCDDTRSTVSPAGTEACNTLDDDCDGTADDGIGTTWYRDADSDAHGTASKSLLGCSAPSGYVASSDDCDDGVGSVYPGATEICDGVDQDCDGTADDAATDMDTFYADTDGDGYGDVSDSTIACTAPSGFVSDATDCDDSEATVFPGGPEYCNGVDDDCDGTVDDDVVTYTFYADTDDDGLGDASSSVVDCTAPSGYVANADDCDDADATVGAAAAWYADADEDGFGDAAASTAACEQPSGYVADASDCDDSDDTVGDGFWWYADDDDDGLGDAATSVYACSAPSGYVAGDTDCDDADVTIGGPSTWYADEDNDGFGEKNLTTEACDQPSGYVADATDCDDRDTNVYPGAVDQCRNSIDDDCDGAVDEDDVYVDWYADADGDGYGDAGSVISDCAAPAGYVARDGDCDEASAAVNPGATELCNDVDDDCDGETDEEGDPRTWYTDGDGDGYGAESVLSCAEPEGAVDRGGDCDDADPTSNPDGVEIPDDGIDQDCDGEDATEVVEYPDESSRTWDQDTGAADPSKAAGCDCDSTGTPIGAWMGLVLVLLSRRRASPSWRRASGPPLRS
jgi:predicted outer membrane repeat protein